MSFQIGGIGSVQEQLLNAIGVNTCGDLYEKRAEIKLLFSNLNFEFYMEASQGFGETSLQPLEEREVKSIGVEKTFKETTDREKLLVICQNLSKELANELKEKNMMGSAVTVVIKTKNFKQTTRVGNLLLPSGDEVAIFDNAKWSLTHLLDKNSKGQTASLRMMGLRMTKLKENPEVEELNFSVSPLSTRCCEVKLPTICFCCRNHFRISSKGWTTSARWRGRVQSHLQMGLKVPQID